jgi:hypothetical protein
MLKGTVGEMRGKCRMLWDGYEIKGHNENIMSKRENFKYENVFF